MTRLLSREQYLRALECAELNGIPDRVTLLKWLEDPEMRETLTYWSDQFYKAPEDLVCVADLQSKEELHYVAAHLNWDDDNLLAQEAILAHRLCDGGTALLLYWYGQGWVYSNPERSDDPDAAFFERLIQRFAKDDFATCSIVFDPREEQFIPTREEMIKGNLNFPGILLAPYDGEVWPRDHDTYREYFEVWQAENEAI